MDWVINKISSYKEDQEKFNRIVITNESSYEIMFMKKKSSKFSSNSDKILLNKNDLFHKHLKEDTKEK